MGHDAGSTTDVPAATQATLDGLCNEIANLTTRLQEKAHQFSDTPVGESDLEVALKAKCTKALWVLDALSNVDVLFSYETH